MFDKASKSFEDNVGRKVEETFDKVFGNEDEPEAPSQGQPPAASQPQGSQQPPSPQPQYPAAEVRETQRLLTELGYEPGPVDGVYGSKTLRAILAFETDRGLRPTGVPSHEVIGHMRTAAAGRPPAALAAPAPEPSWSAPTAQGIPLPAASTAEPAYPDFVQLALRADPVAFAAQREVAGVAYRLAVMDEPACRQLSTRLAEMVGDAFAARDFAMESAVVLDSALANLDATPSALEVLLSDQVHVQPYDFAAGGYPISATPLVRGGKRSLTDQLSAPPCDAGLSLHHALPKAAMTISRVGLGTLSVELEGAPGASILPMADSEARAFEARNPRRTIELVGYVRLEPPVAAFGPLRGRILALEARDPGTGETLYRFPVAPEVAEAATEGVSTEAASFETAPEPSVRALLPLLMQARPDYYDTDQFAVLHDSLQISPGSSVCQETRLTLQNDIARARYLPEGRARLHQALAAAATGPSTKVVLVWSPESIDQYDFTRRGFPLKPSGGAGSVIRDGQLFDVPLGDRCHVGEAPRFGQASPLSLKLLVTGGGAIDFLPMAPERGEAFLGRRGRPPIRVEALVATTASDDGLSGRVVAARVVDPETGEVLHTYDRSLFAQGAQLAGEDTGATTSEPAPLTRFLLTLHAIRHLPHLLDDDLVGEMAERQIAYDQMRYANPNRVDREYEPVFAAAEVQDRHPGFAAEELAPKYRTLLESAAATAPDLVRVEHELRFPDYDTATGRLRFSQFLVQDEARRQPSPLLVPAHDLAGLEQAAPGRVLYAMETGGSSLQVPWRGLEIAIQGGRLPKIRALALDRRLELDGVAVERARAEDLLKVREARFHAALDFRVVGAVEDPEGRGRGLLIGEVEQVQIFGPGREVIARLDPDVFDRLASGAFEKPTPALQMARLEEAPKELEAAVAPEPAQARLDAILGGRTGLLLIRRADADRVTQVLVEDESVAKQYRTMVLVNGLDLPSKARVQSPFGAMTAPFLRNSPGAALVVDSEVFAQKLFDLVADLDLESEALDPDGPAPAEQPTEPSPSTAQAVTLQTLAPGDERLLLVRRRQDAPIERVFEQSGVNYSSQMREATFGTRYLGDVELVLDLPARAQTIDLDEAPDVLRLASGAAVVLQREGLETIWPQISDLDLVAIRFPTEEYQFGIPKDHTKGADAFAILGITGGMDEAAALEQLNWTFAPEEIVREPASDAIRISRGACEPAREREPARAAETGAYSLTLGLAKGMVTQVRLRQVVEGDAAEVALAAFAERYGRSQRFREVRHLERGARRIVVGWGEALDAERVQLGRVAAKSPPAVLEAVVWVVDGVATILLQLDAVPTVAEVKAAEAPEIKF